MSDEQQLARLPAPAIDWQARAEKAEATLDRIVEALDSMTYERPAPNLAWALGVQHACDRVRKEMER